GFDFKIEGGRIALTWNRLDEVTINYYRMEPEFLFSSSPFSTADPERFAIIRPTASQRQELPKEGSRLEIALPASLRQTNAQAARRGRPRRKCPALWARADHSRC